MMIHFSKKTLKNSKACSVISKKYFFFSFISLKNLKKNKARNNQSASFIDDATMSTDTKNLIQRVQARERNQSEDYQEEVSKSRISGDDEVKNLREKLLISETRLAKLQEFNSNLLKKLTNAEAELKVIKVMGEFCLTFF